LFGLEIGCFVQKSFDLSIENDSLRKLHIKEMERLTAGEVKQFLPQKVIMDNKNNILVIQRKQYQHGNSIYDGTNVYSKI
jgi:hypothetical protein